MNSSTQADSKKRPAHKTVSCRLNNLAITVEKEGACHYAKASFSEAVRILLRDPDIRI